MHLAAAGSRLAGAAGLLGVAAWWYIHADATRATAPLADSTTPLALALIALLPMGAGLAASGSRSLSWVARAAMMAAGFAALLLGAAASLALLPRDTPDLVITGGYGWSLLGGAALILVALVASAAAVVQRRPFRSPANAATASAVAGPLLALIVGQLVVMVAALVLIAVILMLVPRARDRSANIGGDS